MKSSLSLVIFLATQNIPWSNAQTPYSRDRDQYGGRGYSPTPTSYYSGNQNQRNQDLNRPNTDPSSPYDNQRGSGGGFYGGNLGGGTSNLGYNSFQNLDGVEEQYYCPEYWIAYRSACYRFIKSPKRSWLDAKKICQASQADLVNVDSLDKHSFILKHLIVDNQKQNRYFISAKQTGPRSWINDDNTQLVNLEDGFSFDEDYAGSDDLYDQQNLRDKYNNKFNLNRNYADTLSQKTLTGYTGNNPNVLGGAYNPRDRVVYGFSYQKSRWLFMPAYDFENNLFICESTALYNVNNYNLLADNRRTFDYGLDVKDIERIPRGPYFIKQPRDTTYDTSKRKVTNDVTLGCLAAGWPTPTYSWYKEEFVNDNLTYTRIDPITNPQFTISGGNLIIYNPDQQLNQGTYHCVAENKYGRILSESVQLNFGFILEFNLKRSDETGDMNWGKALFCDPPQHYPGVKYYWSRDYFPNFVEEDQRVFVSNDGALYFSALETVDRGKYSCTVQSLVSDTGRNGPFFGLRAKPHPNYQALQMANTFPKVFPDAPIADEEIRLECMAFGYPVPSYNWTRKDGNLPRHSYQISYQRVLIIPNATLNDNGEYICTVKNDRKELKASVTVNIQMRPNFTIPLRDKVKDYNTDVSFICEANAVPDVNYTWYKNGMFLDREKLDRDKYIIQDNVLKINYLDPDKDDGMYQCKAENQLKGVYSSAQLRVLSMKPSFKKRPLETDIYAIYNGNTTIVCDPEAAPRPKFQWKKDGNMIGSGGHRKILPSGTLVISPTSRDDEGVYTCLATNAYGTDESKARLIVLQELRFTRTLPAITLVTIHDYVFLHCDVFHDEILDVAIIWMHNGQLLGDQSYDKERFVVTYNQLEILNITLLDAGEYECVAKSAVNQISTKTNLIVQGPPGAPGGVKVIDIRKKDAVLEWIDGANNGKPIFYYNIFGRTNWNRTWHNVTEGVIAHEVDRYTGRKRAEISGLTPWSSYEFSVSAVNDFGVGPQSTPSPQASTHHDKPYVAVRNVGGGGGKIGDLTITWTPLMSQEQNSLGIYYKIFWRLHGKSPEWASEVLEKHGNVGQAVVHIPLDNYYTAYDVKVQAWNNLGAGPESNISTIFSAEDMPQVAPQQNTAISFNSTALNVSWIPVENTREKIRGKLIGHRLKYWKKDHNELDAVYYLSRSTRPWALIVGLEPDTYYFVKSMAYNAAGEGPESERFLERTYRKAPQQPPSSVHIFGINPSTIRVVWRYVAPSQEEEPVEGFKIRIWESDQDLKTANDTFVKVGRKLEAYVDNLTPGKAYKLRVLAYSNGGDGRMSSPTLNFQMGITQTPLNAAYHIRIDKMLILAVLSTLYLVQMTIF